MTQRQLYQWVKRKSKGWAGVNRHFRSNVEVFSRAVVRAQSSQVRKIAGCAEGKADSQRRRLQRFIQQEQPLAAFFSAWTETVVQASKTRQVVLVVDETKLRNQLGVMV